MIRKFDRLLMTSNTSKIIVQNINKKYLGTLSHQFNNYDNFESRYPKREPIKHKLNRKLALDLTVDKNLNSMKNYYNVLGLKEQSSINDIKRAYYVLAKKFHPDRIGKKNNTNFETEKFKEISEAYNVLSDETKRLEYDKKGYIENNEWSAPRIIASKKFQVSDLTRKLNNILKDNSLDGESVSVVPSAYIAGEIELTLTFLQSIQGTTKDFNIQTLNNCNNCSGRSSNIGKRKTVNVCTNCQGTGFYPFSAKSYKNRDICGKCNGTRIISNTDCNICKKRGYINEEFNIPIKIPPGIKSNEVIQVNHPDGKQKLNFRVKVLDDNIFQRIGNDIYTQKELTFTEAALGGKFRVRGVYGNVLLNLDPGTDAFFEKRLKGQGVKARSAVGDLIVKFIIKMPKTLTAKQKSLLTMLQRIERTSNTEQYDDAN